MRKSNVPKGSRDITTGKNYRNKERKPGTIDRHADNIEKEISIHQLFSYFTADIIKQHTVFTR